MGDSGDPSSAVSQGSGTDGWRTVGAYASIYIIWGSTYLAIKLVSQHGAFVMAGSRFLVAGALLLAFAWWRGDVRRSDFSRA